MLPIQGASIMQTYVAAILATVALGMGGAAPVSPSMDVAVAIPSSDDGDKVAKALQARFDNQVDQCEGGKPAYHCSGLIMRATGSTHPFTLPSHTIARGIASFSYVRGDTDTSPFINNHQGIILKGNFEDLQQKTHTACIYPDNAESQTDYADRSSARHQCSGSTDTHSSDADPSSCQSRLTVSVGAPSTSWKVAFKQKYTAPYWGDEQCSFSTQHAGQFYAAVQLSVHPTDDPWNEMILSPWSKSDQEPLPGDIIEAIWYVAGEAAAREGAQKIVQAYRKTYGKPIYAVSVNFEKGTIIYEP